MIAGLNTQAVVFFLHINEGVNDPWVVSWVNHLPHHAKSKTTRATKGIS